MSQPHVCRCSGRIHSTGSEVIMKVLGIALLMAALAGAVASSAYGAAAPVPQPTATAAPLKYTVTITPRFGRGRQWTGALTISVNANGGVTGTYKTTSIVPDPFYSQHVTVSGHEKSKQIELIFHMLPPKKFKVEAQFFGDNFSGTATDENAKSYDFLAQRLH
jgi:hypothetical protein